MTHRGAIVVTACLLAGWPSWVWLAQRLGDGGDEPFGLLALAATGICLWRRRQEIAFSLRIWRWLVPALLVGLGAMTLLHLPPLLRGLGAISLMLAALAAWTPLCPVPGVWVLAWASLPVLASLQFWGGAPLRLLSSLIAQGLTVAAGVQTGRVGVTLLVGGVPVVVDGPCSGVRMLWTATVAVAAVAAWQGWSWPRTGLALACAVAATVLANGWRTASLALGHAGLLPATDLLHAATGMVALILALGPVLWLLQPSRLPK